MTDAGELTLHPHELAPVCLRLLVSVCDVHSQEVAAVLGPRLIADPPRCFVVRMPELTGEMQGRVERDVGVAMLSGPFDGLGREHPGNPDARVRLLQHTGPRIDNAILVVLTFPVERSVLGEYLHQQVMSFVEALTVVRGVRVET